jgi:mono/diheme cytochrome c family protein
MPGTVVAEARADSFSGEHPMRVVNFVLVGLCWFAAVPPASAQSAIEKGQAVYTAQKCSVCHSIAGKGNAKGPLDNVGAKLKADEIREWIVDAPGMTAKTKAARKPAMKPYTLPKEDVDALVAYMASLKK